MGEMRQALESNNRNAFLKLFDARRMPGYTLFRDQVAEFFGRYNSFQTEYHVMQVAEMASWAQCWRLLRSMLNPVTASRPMSAKA